jgi:hypothetical protein
MNCDRCDKSFATQKLFRKHRSDMAGPCADWRHTPSQAQSARTPVDKHFGISAFDNGPVVVTGYVDLDKPRDEVVVVPTYEDCASSESGTIDSDDGVKCHDCKRIFNSMGAYNNHMLGCTPVLTSNKTRGVRQATVSSSSPVIVGHNSAAIRVQQPSLSRGRGNFRGRPGPLRAPSAPKMAPPAPRQPLQYQASLSSRPMPVQTRMNIPPQQLPPMPASVNMGGVEELDQARQVQAKTLRLLIQSDIFILIDGKINVCELSWSRIGVARQRELIAMLDSMCHLPRILQGEYIPAPKAFRDENNAPYQSTDFKPSPIRNPMKPGLGAVAISCSKVMLADGCQEVVKIAAVDLLTCRVLMNHLVCTNPHAEVKDWYSPVTGLFSWNDMEGARKAGYKVFKGWSAAREALHKFVDNETIIVGHNLRSDLDALRMIHGRAVDIAKIVEKAAQGPLSKAQLALDGLCRDYATIKLRSDPEYGRDSLMNAFAVREFGLWAIKNNDKLVSVARQKSREYQLVMPRAAVAVA